LDIRHETLKIKNVRIEKGLTASTMIAASLFLITFVLYCAHLFVYLHRKTSEQAHDVENIVLPPGW
jgi:hypothetical protein